MFKCYGTRCTFETKSRGDYRRHLKELPCWSRDTHHFRDKEFGTKFSRPRVRVFSVVEEDENGNPRYTKVIEVLTGHNGRYEYMAQYFDRGRPEGVRRRPIFTGEVFQDLLNQMADAGFLSLAHGTVAVRKSTRGHPRPK